MQNFITADCPMVDADPIEMHSVKEKYNRLLATSEISTEAKDAIAGAVKTLPFFAEAYGISANIKDYVISPTIIMPSDLPNRKGISFPLKELFKANTNMGRVTYQTWKNRPTFVEHVSADMSKARGLVFDTFIKPIKNTPHYKVFALCGFDRTKDPQLVNDILTKKRTSYSMGAWCDHYQCSVCDAVHNPAANVMGCSHLNVKEFKIGVMPDRKLIFAKAINSTGFEVSSVNSPAYRSAADSPFFSLFSN